MLNLIVDRNHFTGMQSQIASQIAALIRCGSISQGSILPSEAKLSEHYKISRNVVRESYRILRNKKLVKSLGRGGWLVISPTKNVSTENWRIQLPAQIREKIEVISLFQDENPNKFIEGVLNEKVEQLFASYLQKHQSAGS